eukprot:CFRG6344T1
MPPVKKSKAIANESQQSASQWMCIGDKRAFESDAEGGVACIVISLPHPRTSDLVRFMISGDRKELFELNHVNGAAKKNMKKSWLIGNSIQMDGTFYLFTRMDPVLLILPAISKYSESSTAFATLEDIFTSSGNSNYHSLEECCGLSGLNDICDTREAGDIMAYRLSFDKLLIWLAKKVTRTADALAETRTNVGTAAQSDLLVEHSDVVPVAVTAAHTRYALDLVGEYLSPSLFERLASHMSINLVASVNVGEMGTKENIMNNGANLKRPSAKDEPTSDYTKLNSKAFKAKKQKFATGRSSVLTKVNTRGMRSLGSYFSKPAK